MKRAYAKSQYAKPYESRCRELYPDEAERIFGKAEEYYLAGVMHTRLIRTRTEALGGDCCDYWYVGDKSPALESYKDLKQI